MLLIKKRTFEKTEKSNAKTYGEKLNSHKAAKLLNGKFIILLDLEKIDF